MTKYSALDIARWFVHRNLTDVENQEDEKMTFLKLMNLLYYAQGCSLALDKGALFEEKIVAWEHGPAVEEVWKSFDDIYTLQVNDNEMVVCLSKFSDEDNELLEDVYSVFGKYSTFGLRTKAQSESLWRDATKNGKVFNAEITKDAIAKYFKDHYIENSQEDNIKR